MSSPTPNLLPRKLRFGEITHSGKSVHVTATQEERQAIARALDLVSLDTLEAQIEAAPWGREGVKITGTLKAVVVQRCVVTLQPVSDTFEADFARTYLPAAALAKRARRDGSSMEIDIVFDEEDPPEGLDGPDIDLGAIILEELALGLNPYPRHPDAPPPDQIEEVQDTSSPDSESPFNALKKLRDLS